MRAIFFTVILSSPLFLDDSGFRNSEISAIKLKHVTRQLANMTIQGLHI